VQLKILAAGKGEVSTKVDLEIISALLFDFCSKQDRESPSCIHSYAGLLPQSRAYQYASCRSTVRIYTIHQVASSLHSNKFSQQIHVCAIINNREPSTDRECSRAQGQAGAGECHDIKSSTRQTVTGLDLRPDDCNVFQVRRAQAVKPGKGGAYMQVSIVLRWIIRLPACMVKNPIHDLCFLSGSSRWS
jgi:hypothetical protein